MKKCRNNLMAVLLAVIMILCAIPFEVGAMDDAKEAEITNRFNIMVDDNSPEYVKEIAEKSKIYDEFEVVSMREENVKHFALADGTFEAVVYPYPVHTISDNGIWVDKSQETKDFNMIELQSLISIDNSIIDNSILASSSVNSVYDTYISSNSATVNYNSSTELWVGTNQITYIRFNLPHLTEIAYIDSATLSVYYHYYSNVTDGYVTLGVYRAKDYWASSSITWNNAGEDKKLSSIAYDQKNMTAYGSQRKLCDFDITEMVGEWYAGVNNYGVGIKWDGGTNSSVLLDSKEYGVAYSPKLTIQYTLNGAPIADGTYFINNMHSPLSDKVIQIDDGDSNNNFQTNNATTELWSISGSDEQLWNVNFMNKYYTITSVKSGKALSVKLGNENTNESDIVQYSYLSGNLRQIWDIGKGYTGEFYIKPRSARETGNNWCVSAGFGTFYHNGWSVKQRIYTYNYEHRDEWNFIKYGTEAFLLGVIDSGNGHDHTTFFTKIDDAIKSLGYFSFDMIGTTYITRSSVQEKMQNSKIFVSRGHGSYDNTGSYIILAEDCTQWIHTEQVYNYETDIPVINLSNCDLMLFVGCYTGNHDHSIANAAVKAGASCAIGFNGSIDCSGANTWTEKFFSYRAQGESISLSAYHAGQNCSAGSGCRSYKVVN